MTKTLIWVRPKGFQSPRPGTRLRVDLQQDLGGRPRHRVGNAEVFEGNRVLVRLVDTEAGRTAAALLKEDCLDAWYWGSKPTLRLRP